MGARGRKEENKEGQKGKKKKENVSLNRNCPLQKAILVKSCYIYFSPPQKML